MILNNIYAKPNIAALVQLQLSVEEVEGLQFCLNWALDEMSGADRDCGLVGAHRTNKGREEEEQRTDHGARFHLPRPSPTVVLTCACCAAVEYTDRVPGSGGKC